MTHSLLAGLNAGQAAIDDNRPEPDEDDDEADTPHSRLAKAAKAGLFRPGKRHSPGGY